MGSWGTGPFDNDDALGFFGELEDAAAALVAAGCSEGATIGHPSIDSWLSGHRPTPAPEDQRLAAEALKRLTAPDSEWLELWQQAGAEQRVRTELGRLRAMLHREQG